MGFPPQTVDRMSLWQFMAALDGWRTAHGQKKSVGDMSDDRLRDLGIEGF